VPNVVSAVVAALPADSTADELPELAPAILLAVSPNHIANVLRGTRAVKPLPSDAVPNVVSAVVVALPDDELHELAPAFLSVSAEPPMRIAAELPRALKLRDVTSEELDSGWGSLHIGRMNSESAVCSGQQTVVELNLD
jgi:hypothetical protein